MGRLRDACTGPNANEEAQCDGFAATPGAHCGLLLAVRRDVGDDFGPFGHIFELVRLLLLLGTWSGARTSDPILRNLLVNIHIEELEASWYCNCLGPTLVRNRIVIPMPGNHTCKRVTSHAVLVAQGHVQQRTGA